MFKQTKKLLRLKDRNQARTVSGSAVSKTAKKHVILENGADDFVKRFGSVIEKLSKE